MNKKKGIGIRRSGSFKLLSSALISSLFYLLFIFSGVRNSYAVDWSGKVGLGLTFQAGSAVTLLGYTPVALSSVGGGASAIIGLAKMFRLEVELSFLSLSYSGKSGNTQLTLSGSGFGVSLSGLLDAISKDGGVLYLILSGGYSTSLSTEKIERKEARVSAKAEGPSASGINVGLGAGVEAFVLNSVGIALDGFILNFSSGTVKQTSTNQKGESVTESVDASALNFGLFPSIRLSARIYF